MFLYTDYEGNMAIYSDIELVDWIRASHMLPKAYTLLSMNAVVTEIEDKFIRWKPGAKPQRDIKMTIGSAQIHETDKGRVVIFSIPSNTISIKILPPVAEAEKAAGRTRASKDYLDMIELRARGEVMEIP